MSVVHTTNAERFDAQVPLLIVGAGAAGLCAALAAKETGVDAVLIERHTVPSGSTALSAGLIPAAGTRFQRDKGITDSAELSEHNRSRTSEEPNHATIEALQKEFIRPRIWAYQKQHISYRWGAFLARRNSVGSQREARVVCRQHILNPSIGMASTVG